MKHLMHTHTFHSEETKKIFQSSFWQEQLRLVAQPMMKKMLYVPQHGSENMTSRFVTGQLIVKI